MYAQWTQWPLSLQAQTYQNLPHGQVDWAALAQQWIAQKEAASITTAPVDGERREEHLAPASATSGIQGFVYNYSADPNFLQHGAMGYGGWTGGNWSGPGGWNVPPGVLQPPLPPVEKAVIDYGHTPTQTFEHDHGGQFNQPAEPIDYNHGNGSDAFQYQHQHDFSDSMNYAPDNWGPQDSIHEREKSRDSRHFRHGRGDKSHFSSSGHSHTPEFHSDVPVIDAQKRKQLPLWIRQGLEKMEEEKRKALEKERRKQELEQRKHLDMEMSDDEAEHDDERTDRKSRFESEDEESRSYHGDSEADEKKYARPRSPSPVKTREERQQELMMKTRRMMTKVLLTVTEELIHDISREVYKRALTKVPAKQLAHTSALTSITGAIGLSGYGSESDEEASRPGSVSAVEDRNDDSDSEAELEAQINQRKLAFEKKMAARREEEEKESSFDSGKERDSESQENYADGVKRSYKDEFEAYSENMDLNPVFKEGKRYEGIPGLEAKTESDGYISSSELYSDIDTGAKRASSRKRSRKSSRHSEHHETHSKVQRRHLSSSDHTRRRSEEKTRRRDSDRNKYRNSEDRYPKQYRQVENSRSRSRERRRSHKSDERRRERRSRSYSKEREFDRERHKRRESTSERRKSRDKVYRRRRSREEEHVRHESRDDDRYYKSRDKDKYLSAHRDDRSEKSRHQSHRTLSSSSSKSHGSKKKRQRHSSSESRTSNSKTRSAKKKKRKSSSVEKHSKRSKRKSSNSSSRSTSSEKSPNRSVSDDDGGDSGSLQSGKRSSRKHKSKSSRS